MQDIRFNAFERLIGKDNLLQIQQKRFAIIGLGGVGSWAAEALVRSGVEKIRLIDFDEVCLSNTNRQIQATAANIGKTKALALKERFLSIHPKLEVQCVEDFFSADNAKEVLQDVDVVIDAIDSLGAKCVLAAYCRDKNLALVVSGAAGGKSDPTRITVEDLSKTMNDPLLQKMRKKLRRDFRFPRGDKKFRIRAVYSKELPHLQEDCEKPQGALDCETGYGNTIHITATMGLFCSHLAIEEALKPKA